MADPANVLDGVFCEGEAEPLGAGAAAGPDSPSCLMPTTYLQAITERAARGDAPRRARLRDGRRRRRVRRRVQGDRTACWTSSGQSASATRRSRRRRSSGPAIGAAIAGLRPVCEMQFADFVACGFDQLVNVAGKMHYRLGLAVPLTIRLPSGGGFSGGPFHSQNPEAWFMHAPGIKVLAPSTAADAKGLLAAAIRDPNPVVFLEHKNLYRRIKDEVPDGAYVTEMRARVAREGSDLTVIAYGAMVHAALEAAERSDASIEVIDLRSLGAARHGGDSRLGTKTSKVLVVDEANRTCAAGAEVAALIAEQAFEDLDGPVRRLATPDVPIPFSPTLEQAVLPGPTRSLRRSMTSSLTETLLDVPDAGHGDVDHRGHRDRVAQERRR